MLVTAAWIVLCPGATPSVTVADADPVSSVTDETAPNDAVPAVTGQVRLQVVRQFVERINLHPQPRHGGPLLGELAPHREPVRGAVLPAPQGEARQRHRAGEGGEAGTAHRPYRWRPG